MADGAGYLASGHQRPDDRADRLAQCLDDAWTILIGGQSIPKTGAGLYDYHLPLGSDGLLGIVGTLGLWIALLLLMLEYLPWAGAAFKASHKQASNAVAANATASN